MSEQERPECGSNDPAMCGRSIEPPVAESMEGRAKRSEMQVETWKVITKRAEAEAARLREALERIAAIDWTEPPVDMPDELARAALSPTPDSEEER